MTQTDSGTIRFQFASRPEQTAIEVDFCEPQLNLLAHAQALELEIGSRCGGHGVCGGDRVRVLLNATERNQLISEITEAERKHLSPEALAAGVRLACQCFPEKREITLPVEVCDLP